MRPATRADCPALPPPTLRAPLPLRGRYDAAEAERLRRGLAPSHPEDRWHIFYEDEHLYLHRRISGVCIYALHLRPEGEGLAVQSAWVNRDPAQYTQADLSWDAALAQWLIDRLLLGLRRPFPAKPGLDPDRAHNFALTVAGRAIFPPEDEG